MGYQDDWNELTSDPEWEDLPAGVRAKVARKFSQKVVRKQVKGNSPEMKAFIQANVFDVQDAGKPKVQDRGLVREFASEVKNNGIKNALTFGKESARALVDTNPIGVVRRTTGAVADAAYDVVAKPTGLPSSKDLQKARGTEGGRLLPRDLESEQSIPGVAAQISMGFLDPINLAAPLNAFKAAPVVSKGINLLPKAPPPALLPQAAKNAIGAGVTNATLAAPLSVGSQLLDTGKIDPGKTALDVGLSAGVGLGLGAAAPVLKRAADSKALLQTNQAAQARAANGPVGKVSPAAPGTVTADMLNQNRMAMSASEDFFRPSVEVPRLDVPATPGARPQATRPGVPLDARTKPVTQGTPPEQAVQSHLEAMGYEAPSPTIGRPIPVDAPAPIVKPETPPVAPAAETPVPAQPLSNPFDDMLKRWEEEAAQATAKRASFNPEARSMDEAYGVPAAPPPRNLSALVSETDGAFNPAAAGPAIQQGANVAGDAAALVGKGYKAVTEGYTGAIDWVLDRTRARVAFDKAREFKAAAKSAPSNSPGLEGLRRAFISNYGVSPEVLRLADEAQRVAHRAATPMRKKSLELLERLTPEQQKHLELAITEPGRRQEFAALIGVSKAEANDMIQSVIEDAQRMSQMLKEVGAVTEEGVARWDGQYLPRSYEKYMGTVSRFFKASKGLAGKKGRGIEELVAPSSVPEMQAQGWEFRGEVNGQARMWRDYTLDERLDMGQVHHASNAMSKMAKEFERDFRNGKLLSDIAKGGDDKGAFAIPIPKKVKGQPDPVPPQGYTLWENIDATVPGTGIKKWGDLAGHYVRDDVAHYLKWNLEIRDHLNFIKTWTGTNMWKRFKTIWNPAHYANNFMANVPVLELAGGSSGDLPAAFREVSTGGELFRKLEEFGTVRTGQVAQDLALSLEGVQMGAGTPLDMLSTAMRAVKNLESRGGDLAQATDDLFKVALVKHHMDAGMAFEDAARLAEKTFYNPQAVTAPAAQVAEAFGLPFARVLWYSVDKMSDLILENPAKALALFSYFQGTKMLIDAYNGTTNERKKARDLLVPDHLKQPGGLGYQPTPLKDSKGNPLLLNTANWNPLNFTDSAEQTKLPYFPSSLMPGGVAPALYQALVNKDLFRNKDLRTAAGDETGRFLLESLGPGVIPRLETLGNAVAGRESYSGLPYDVPTAAANLMGLKLQPYSPERGVKNLVRDFRGDESEIKGRIKMLATLMERNPQDAATYQKEIEHLIARLQTRSQDFGKKMDTARPALLPTPAR